MRIVWKDTAVARADFKYRGYWVECYLNGWTINIPGDTNIYKTNRCTKNAIDETLGLDDLRHKKLPKRLEYGYEVIRTKRIRDWDEKNKRRYWEVFEDNTIL